MTPQTPSDAREAAEVLGALLTEIPASTAPRERRIRGALRAAIRALREPGVRELDALADEMGSEDMRAATGRVAEDRALRAVERSYRRQP